MPYCTNCGTEERAAQRFCPVCGAPTSGSLGLSPMPQPPSGDLRHEAQVLLGISLDPPSQSRWSILFRFIACLPLFVVAVAIGFVAFFVTVAAWFAALFTGRVPDSLQEFLTNALRLYVNILAYQYLLVARWPGVTFHQRPTDQATVAIDHVGLRRWSVFFRIVLSYPANLVSAVLSFGTFPLLVVMWLWGLVAGREPKPLHQALALILRYQIRYQAYVCLLTPTQPFRGLFGDGVVPSMVTVRDGTDSTLTPAAVPTSAQPLPTRWLVEKATKVALIVAVVLGVLVYAVSAQIERPFVTRVEARVARSLLVSSHSTADNAIATFVRTVQGCPTGDFQGCAASAATRAHRQLDGIVSSTFIDDLVPPGSRGEADLYGAALAALAAEMVSVQTLPTAQSQMAIIDDQLPTTLADFNADYQVLDGELQISL